jgi:hypothetical protein
MTAQFSGAAAVLARQTARRVEFAVQLRKHNRGRPVRARLAGAHRAELSNRTYLLMSQSTLLT